MSKTTVEIIGGRMAFGAVLEGLRKAKGYTSRYAFASACPLNEQKIGQIEKGGSCYTIDTLAMYLQGLDLTLADLLSGKAKGGGNDGEEEKRPVGRPKKVVEPVRIPALRWEYFEHLQHPSFGTLQKCNWAGIGARSFWCAEEPSPLWSVRHVVCEPDAAGLVEWMIVNSVSDPYIRGIAGNRQAAMDAIDAKRREIGDYAGWDYSAEDAEG